MESAEKKNKKKNLKLFFKTPNNKQLKNQSKSNNPKFLERLNRYILFIY